jgi:hypothetical protein
LYVTAARSAGEKGEIRARDLVDKIGDSDLRKRTRAYVDFSLVNRAIKVKDAQEAMRLLGSSELTHIHRTWALLEIVRLLQKSEPARAIELLDEAAAAARRIGGGDVDRPRGLFGVATQTLEVDKVRVWEAASEAVKAANSAADFTGEDAQIVARFQSRSGSSTSSFTVANFNLTEIFGSLALEDLYRSIELARNFTADAPRATATLAIARAVLVKKDGN